MTEDKDDDSATMKTGARAELNSHNKREPLFFKVRLIVMTMMIMMEVTVICSSSTLYDDRPKTE